MDHAPNCVSMFAFLSAACEDAGKVIIENAVALCFLKNGGYRVDDFSNAIAGVIFDDHVCFKRSAADRS